MKKTTIIGRIMKFMLTTTLMVAVGIILMLVRATAVAEESPTPLTFTAQEANSTITYKDSSSGDVSYKLGKGEWQSYVLGTTITLSNIDDTVSFKRTNVNNDGTVNYPAGRFSMTGKIAASGDVTSLINGAGGDVELVNRNFFALFVDCASLTTAPNLPSTTLTENCYQFMFKNCSGLVEAPELPALNLAKSCYFEMFGGCTKLEEAPKLPALELADSCYFYMFNGCSSLLYAPELPALKLAPYCYGNMFDSCTRLENAPELPAKVLDYCCYFSMFKRCTGLVNAPVLKATGYNNTYNDNQNSFYSAYFDMFNGCDFDCNTTTDASQATWIFPDKEEYMQDEAYNQLICNSYPHHAFYNREGFKIIEIVAGGKYIASSKPTPTKDMFDFEGPSSLLVGETRSATVTPKEDISGIGAVTVKYYTNEECTEEAIPNEAMTYFVGIDVAGGIYYKPANNIHDESWAFTLEYPKYDINKNNCANGSFKVYVNGKEAADACENDNVVVEPKADARYSVDTVIYNDGTSDIAVTKDENGRYSFKMPAQAVTIKVTFKIVIDGEASLSGKTKYGETLSVSANVAPSFVKDICYQWYRVDDTGENSINGATKSTYKLSKDDIGKKIKVTVSVRGIDGTLSVATTDKVKKVDGKLKITTSEEDLKLLYGETFDKLSYESSNELGTGNANVSTEYRIEDTDTYIKGLPKNVGTYYIRAIVLEDDTHYEAVSEEVKVVISPTVPVCPALPVINASCSDDGKKVSDFADQLTEGFAFAKADQDKIVKLGDGIQVHLIYTPKDTKNYLSISDNLVVTIKLSGHSMVEHPAVAATCNATGTILYYSCSVCEKYFSDAEGKNEIADKKITTDKTAHTPGEPVKENVVEATADKEGSYDEVVYCTVCKAELSRTGRVIEATGKDKEEPESEGDVTVDPETGKLTFDVNIPESVTYTGSAITFKNAIYAVDESGNKIKLAEGSDYTAAYKNNKDVGTATVTYTGKGEYKDVAPVKKDFIIKPIDIGATDSKLAVAELVFTDNQKGKVKANPAVYYDGKKLKLNKDYYLMLQNADGSYSNYNGKDKLSESTNLKVAGYDGSNYTGERIVKVNFLEKEDKRIQLGKASVKGVKAQAYTGKAVEINQSLLTIKAGGKLLTYGTDYEVSYIDNEAVGTAYMVITAKEGSDYVGSKLVAFKITGTKLSKATVTLTVSGKAAGGDDAATKEVGTKKGYEATYTGSAIEPEVKIKALVDGKEVILTEGTDYTVTYKKNRKKGTALVIITGRGGFTGSKTVKFAIK